MTHSLRTIAFRHVSSIARVALTIAAAASLCFAQSSQSSPAAKPPDSPDAPTAPPNPSSTPPAAAKVKHVYTNEDFESHGSHRTSSSPAVNAAPAASGSYLTCDAVCE